jgi:hypothetical protein
MKWSAAKHLHWFHGKIKQHGLCTIKNLLHHDQKAVSARAMIFAQGEESNNFYFVLSGEVRVVHYRK